MLRKLGFYCFTCLANVESELIYFVQLVSQRQTVARDFK